MSICLACLQWQAPPQRRLVPGRKRLPVGATPQTGMSLACLSSLRARWNLMGLLLWYQLARMGNLEYREIAKAVSDIF
jgi:hypothetical protein